MSAAAVASAVRERPILFSSPMVRAILAGSKTQTRRVMKPQPYPNMISVSTGVEPDGIDGTPYPKGEIVCHCDYYPPSATLWKGGMLGADAGELECCPYGMTGERLWVRETWLPDPPIDGTWPGDVEWNGCGRSIAGVPAHYRTPERCLYAASWDGGALTWRPSIHMPRWASRLTLEVAEVRVQRLQEITAEDARAEGAPVGEMLPGSVNGEPAQVMAMDPRVAFAWLWDSINLERGYQQMKGTFSWASNPWVWAITFRRIA